MVRNGGQSVSDMLAESQSGLTSWINTNLEGCKPDHIKRAVSISISIMRTNVTKCFPILLISGRKNW